MTVRLVPTDYADIAAAVAACAATGDTIRLESAHSPFQGANNKNIDPGGKDIIFEGDTTDPADTVIDCENSGRAFYIHNGETLDLIIRNLTIYDGYAVGASVSGGGVWLTNTSKLTISNCIIDDCRACWGAGIKVDVSSELVMSDSILKNGHNADYAGALYFHTATGTITNCQFYSNSAVAGGALYCYSSSPTFTCCLFYDNTAASRGGAIFIRQDAHPTFHNCTITENSLSTSVNHGGGLHTYNASGRATLTDCILWNNTAPIQPYDAQCFGAVVFNYCDCRSALPYIDGSFTRNNCIEADPQFVAGPGGNYYLSQIAAGQDADSPCLDAGSDTVTGLGLGDRITRTDQSYDVSRVDMGWHYVGAFAWETIGIVPHDDAQWVYSLLSPRLDDLADAEFRVVPVDKAGNDGTALALSSERVVRTPDGPDFTVTFDSGTTKVTFAAV